MEHEHTFRFELGFLGRVAVAGCAALGCGLPLAQPGDFIFQLILNGAGVLEEQLSQVPEAHVPHALRVAAGQRGAAARPAHEKRRQLVHGRI
jgi:hypothetical protein